MACSNLAGVDACEVTNTLVTTITTLIVRTFESTITRTEQMVTTVQGTFGQPLTWQTSSPSWSVDTSTTSLSPTPWSVSPSASPIPTGNEYTVYTASTMTTLAAAFTTMTELVVVLIDAQGSVLTTSTLTVPAATSKTTSSMIMSPSPTATSQPQDSGWNTWSKGAKAGLVAGCILVFLFFVFVVLCFCMRFSGTTWIANDWSVTSHPGRIPGHSIYGNGAAVPGVRGGGEEELQERGNTSKCLRYPSDKDSGGDPDETIIPPASKRVAEFYRPPTRG